ncbi:MAG: hypothetical protein IPJ17_06775 [Holophagales bacterium]|nr:MAG: hypothetical protein IPJ17_06775 [Holophagales bacterium]
MEIAAYLALLTLVWGLSAGERGFYHDDGLHLALVHHEADRLAGALRPIASPTRFLVAWPYALALATAWPALALQMVDGAAMLALALAVRALARRLLPGERRSAFVAGALVLVATGDLLSVSTVALHYRVAVLACLGALLAAIAALEATARMALAIRLLGVVLLLQASLWTIEVALPVILLAPPLLALSAPGATRRRRALVGALWYGSLLPFGAAFLSALLDRSGYLARTVPALGLVDRARETARLLLWDWTPWRWLRPLSTWYPPPTPLLPPGFGAACGLLAAALVVAAACRLPGTTAGEMGAASPRHRALTAGALVLLGIAAALPYAGIAPLGAYFRTQQVTRIVAALLLALGMAALARRLRRPALALAVPAVFVLLGTWSAVRRQDELVGSWRRAQRELGSILDEVPRLRRGATLVLFHDGAPWLLATEAEYLAQSWFELLYDRRDGDQALVSWSPRRGSGCRSTGAGLDCWGEGQVPCDGRRPCSPRHLADEQIVVLVFRPAEGRYRLAETLSEVLAHDETAVGAGYRPRAWIESAPESDLARRLLSTPAALGLWPPTAPR